jgi:hypothetical protein
MIQKEERAKAMEIQESSSEFEEDDDANDGEDGLGMQVVVTAATVMVKTTGVKRVPINTLAPRRWISSDENKLVQTFSFDVKNYKLVYLWAATPFLTVVL